MNRDQLYRLRHRSRYQRALEDARAIIAQGLQRAAGRAVAVAVSGGKDSTALAHLVAQQCPGLRLLWNDSGLEMPETGPLLQQLAARLEAPLIVTHAPPRSLVEAVREVTDEDAPRVRAALAAHGIAVEFVGLRSDESARRRRVIARLGPMYTSATWGCEVVWPLRRWSTADVFGYIDEHDLPLHPAYTRDPLIDRDAIRVSWVVDLGREKLGSVEHLRRHYPQLYQQLRAGGLA